MAGKPFLSLSCRCPLTSRPDRSQRYMPGARCSAISTTFATRPLSVNEHTVGKWRRRFAKERIGGLTDEYRPGRPRTVSDDQVAEVIERTLNTTPKGCTLQAITNVARFSPRGLKYRLLEASQPCGMSPVRTQRDRGRIAKNALARKNPDHLRSLIKAECRSPSSRLHVRSAPC